MFSHFVSPCLLNVYVYMFVYAYVYGSWEWTRTTDTSLIRDSALPLSYPTIQQCNSITLLPLKEECIIQVIFLQVIGCSIARQGDVV